MDYAQSVPAPLILPRRLSLNGGKQKYRYYNHPSSPSPSTTENDADLTHYYYYPTTTFPPNQHQQAHDARVKASLSSSNPNPPPIFSFGSEQAQDGFTSVATTFGDPNATSTTMNTYTGPSIAMIRGQTSRRHSVANGSPWTTVPPRHALHMPVMKIDPTIWRSEQHQREVYRLMHEGREVEVMKRRGVRNVMDTTEEEDDELSMPGVVQTVDATKALEEREKIRQEWAKVVEEQTRDYERLLQQVAATDAAAQEAHRRNSWSSQLDQQQVQFKTPGQVLHPIVLPMTQQQQQRFPDQPPAPGQQLGQGRTTTAIATTGAPLTNPVNWSAAAVYPNTHAYVTVDTRRPSFTEYRG
ncbi:hypothetical protein BGZ51_006600 [Haplosporangium sp. Z 767]|nr:hypothetical protein BGZ50_003225 [Haplosporangium sp. Z 11]KAF9191880.1 hypothetical protein BGZ51_006600 [Haplosporangium sp. Z 767]